MGMPLRICLIGWSPTLAHDLLSEALVVQDLDLRLGLMEDQHAAQRLQTKFPNLTICALGPPRMGADMAADLSFLAGLEAPGVPTVRAMIQGDPIVRHYDEGEALSLAADIGRRIMAFFIEQRPHLVLASFDRLHSGLALAIARNIQVPFVCLAFTALPAGRMAFAKALVQDALVPLPDRDVLEVHRQSVEAFLKFRSGQYIVPIYRAAFVPTEVAKSLGSSLVGRINRFFSPHEAKDPYSRVPLKTVLRLPRWTPGRRLINRATLPQRLMIKKPPDRPYVLHMLQMAPEMSIDTWAPWYQDQLALVRQLRISIPADHVLLVKPHVSDPDTYSRRELTRLAEKGIQLVHSQCPSRQFLDSACLVTAITSTACLEAALLGKPALMFGRSPYLSFPSVEPAAPPPHLSDQIRRLLNSTPPSDAEVIGALAQYISRYLPGVHNDWSTELPPEAKHRFSALFGRLREYLDNPSSRELWFEEYPFNGVVQHSARINLLDS